MASNIVIKDVEEVAYRNLRREAIKAGLKVGEAASQAFRLWVQQRSLGRVRDREKMRRAAERIDEMRRRIGRVEGWSSTEVIREWRERRRPSEVIKRQAGEHGELKDSFGAWTMSQEEEERIFSSLKKHWKRATVTARSPGARRF